MGKNINRFAVAATAAFVSAGAVQAQDWTGMYVGIEAGSAATDLDFCLSCIVDGFEGWADPSPRSLSLAGMNYGIYAGTNVAQVGNMVYGFEVGYSAGGGALSDVYLDDLDAINEGYEVSVDYLASARARVGYATGSMLLYATGGVATAGITLNNPECDGCSAWGSTTYLDSTHTGTVVGVGIEYMLGNNWTARGQYLAYDFGSAVTDNGDEFGDKDDNSASLSTSVASVGIAYRF